MTLARQIDVGQTEVNTREPRPGFAVVWDPYRKGPLRDSDLVDRAGGNVLSSWGPVTVLGYGAGPLAPRTWSDTKGGGVFWGEIYHCQTVRAALSAVGVECGADPASLVAGVYAAWGETGFQRLEGLFCAVLWDPTTARLVFYRDGSCARALYWHQGNGWAVAATRLDLLTELPGVSGEIAAPGLHEYLRFLDVSPPHTIYGDIHALEPGAPAHFGGDRLVYLSPAVTGDENGYANGSVTNGKWRDSAAWQRISTRLRRQQKPSSNFPASLDALDAALRESIAARLDDARLTGVFLSGGIDSALLCAIAADMKPDAIAAFTVGFCEPGYDEAPIATGIADYLGVRHHLFTYEMAAYQEAFSGFLADIDLPFADPAGLPTWLLYRDCRVLIDVALDGTGADTLVGVMPARHTRLAIQYAALAPERLRRFGAALLRQIPGLAGYTPILDFEAPQDLLVRWKGWSRAEISALCDTEVNLDGTRFYRIYRQFSRGQHFQRYNALLGNLPDDRIHQAAEGSGLRVRFPYWDGKVMRLIQELPQAYRHTEAQPKRLLRALLERYVPRPLWDLPKHGFDFPFVSFLRLDDHALLDRYLSPGVVRKHALLRPALVERYVGQFREGDDSLSFRVWALLILFGWIEQHHASG